LGHDVISRVITLRNKKWKIWSMWWILEFLIVCNKSQINFKVHHISKRMFFMTINKYKCSKWLKVGLCYVMRSLLTSTTFIANIHKSNNIMFTSVF
jgi:hypothetical protein